MSEALPPILFVTGLVLEAAGFALGAVEHLPLVLRFVSPDHVAANRGVSTLQASKILRGSDVGFQQIASIFLETARAQNSAELIKQIQVKEIRLKGTSGLTFGRSGVRETVPVMVALSNGQEVEWELPTIKTKIESLKARHLFVWGVVLFVAGLVIQVVGFFVDWYGKTAA